MAVHPCGRISEATKPKNMIRVQSEGTEEPYTFRVAATTGLALSVHAVSLVTW
jgi:hypothetical protein